MTENNPAGTPPAQNPEGGNKPPAEQGKTLTQAQVDEIIEERLGRDRRSREEALAKDLGMPLKDVKAIIKAKKESDEAQKTELEKLTGERDSLKGELTGAKLEAAKLRALAKVGADPEKIDSLMKRVVGSTPEEIEADVKELQSLGLLAPKTPGAANGAGNPGLAPKTNEPTIDDQIVAAEKAGNWNLVTKLKLDKQREIFK
jgi:DNA-binding transcriptional MerR regulator